MVDLESNSASQCFQSSHWSTIIVAIVVSFVVGAKFSIVLVGTRKVHQVIFRCRENLVWAHYLLEKCCKIAVKVVTTNGYRSRPSKDHYYSLVPSNSHFSFNYSYLSLVFAIVDSSRAHPLLHYLKDIWPLSDFASVHRSSISPWYCWTAEVYWCDSSMTITLHSTMALEDWNHQFAFSIK